MKLQLLTRPECHLCDLAAGLLEQAGLLQQVEVVNIESDLGLLMSYGERVPVIRELDSGREIGWPMVLADVRRIAGDEV